MHVKFVDHRHMLKLSARLVTGQCSMIGTLMLAWKNWILLIKRSTNPRSSNIWGTMKAKWELNNNHWVLSENIGYIWEHQIFKESHSSAPIPIYIYIERERERGWVKCYHMGQSFMKNQSIWIHIFLSIFFEG
jgi:hypothetical protein